MSDALPPGLLTARCRSCGRPIHWAVSERWGTKMPIDVNPVPDGNVQLIMGAAGALLARIASTPRNLPPGALRYTSHFATCEHAAQWKKRA